MNPNNLYYRQIAMNLTGETYEKLYSSNYYAKKIAEHYNKEQYTTLNPLNHYVKDWYCGVTGESEPNTHKPTVWYLRRIVKFLDSSVDETTLNENECLQLILEPSHDILFNPPLDGTDNILAWNKLTQNKTADGVYISHGSILGDGWSNEGLWIAEYDYKYTESWYVGTIFLCNNTKLNSDSVMTGNAFAAWEMKFPPNWGSYTVIDAPSSFEAPNQLSWNHICIEKISEDTIRFVLNDTYEWVFKLNYLPNWDTVHLGSKDNPSDPLSGGSIYFKNIIVKRR